MDFGDLKAGRVYTATSAEQECLVIVDGEPSVDRTVPGW